MKKLLSGLALCVSAIIFASCQSSACGVDKTLSSAAAPAPAADAEGMQTAAATGEATKAAAGNEPLSYAQVQPASPAQCAIQIAAGPPPKPARGQL